MTWRDLWPTRETWPIVLLTVIVILAAGALGSRAWYIVPPALFVGFVVAGVFWPARNRPLTLPRFTALAALTAGLMIFMKLTY